MRIALVTYALEIGGVETFLKLLADFFASAGHEPIFVETQAIGRWSTFFTSEGYKVIQVLPKPLFSRYHHVKRIRRILEDFDLIILNDAPYAQSVLGLLNERTIAIPVLHMSMPTMVYNATANSSNWDVLSAVSPAARQSAVHSGVDETRVICIPNGIKISEEWPKGGHDFGHMGKLHIVYLGAISHIQKGVLHLPGIFKEVLKERINFHLEVVGDGPDLGRLRDALAREWSGAEIILHGALPRQRAMEILSHSDILIMPSHFEGLPLVLLEAMSLGVVPVVSRLPGCTDFVVQNRVNGVLVEVGDENGFANALALLNGDRSLLRFFSLSAWETAKGRFSYKQTGTAYLELAERSRERRLNGEALPRSGKIDKTLLGDLPCLPVIFMRPVRKVLRMFGLFPKPLPDPMLYTPCKG
jgi:glycosyltransferase involved in cell wall biosynthesis